MNKIWDKKVRHPKGRAENQDLGDRNQEVAQCDKRGADKVAEGTDKNRRTKSLPKSICIVVGKVSSQN